MTIYYILFRFSLRLTLVNSLFFFSFALFCCCRNNRLLLVIGHPTKFVFNRSPWFRTHVGCERCTWRIDSSPLQSLLDQEFSLKCDFDDFSHRDVVMHLCQIINWNWTKECYFSYKEWQKKYEWNQLLNVFKNKEQNNKISLLHQIDIKIYNLEMSRILCAQALNDGMQKKNAIISRAIKLNR